MELEEYKNMIRAVLENEVGPRTVKELMELYESDFQTYLEENWSPEVVATEMIMGG